MNQITSELTLDFLLICLHFITFLSNLDALINIVLI